MLAGAARRTARRVGQVEGIVALDWPLTERSSGAAPGRGAMPVGGAPAEGEGEGAALWERRSLGERRPEG